MMEKIVKIIEVFYMEPSKSASTLGLEFSLKLETEQGKEIVLKESDEVEIIETEGNYIEFSEPEGVLEKLKEVFKGVKATLYLTKEVREKIVIFEKSKKHNNFKVEGYKIDVHKMQENISLVQGSRQLL